MQLREPQNEQFITGLFTLLAALGGIWLKEHLDRKKASESTRKQKAIEAYALTGKLMSSLTTLKVICSNLMQNKNFAYADIYNNNPNISYDILEKLELIIVENFYDLTIRQKLLEVEESVNSYNRYLFNIITTVQVNIKVHILSVMIFTSALVSGMTVFFLIPVPVYF